MAARSGDRLEAAARNCQAPPSEPGADSAFRPLAPSAYAMDARLALAREAQRSLNLQY